jgi:hypothetical protein
MMTDADREQIEKYADQHKGLSKAVLNAMKKTADQGFLFQSGIELAIQRIDEAERRKDYDQRERHHRGLTFHAKIAWAAAWCAAIAAFASAVFLLIQVCRDKAPESGRSSAASKAPPIASPSSLPVVISPTNDLRNTKTPQARQATNQGQSIP